MISLIIDEPDTVVVPFEAKADDDSPAPPSSPPPPSVPQVVTLGSLIDFSLGDDKDGGSALAGCDPADIQQIPLGGTRLEIPFVMPESGGWCFM